MLYSPGLYGIYMLCSGLSMLFLFFSFFLVLVLRSLSHPISPSPLPYHHVEEICNRRNQGQTEGRAGIQRRTRHIGDSRVAGGEGMQSDNRGWLLRG
jgi:Na+-transporting methylmalonyl-CoA/oxaloacetate decarboxylase gamma subunit